MKFTCEVIINLPIDKVIALFDDPNNLSKWMEGLQSFEHLSGTSGQPGARSKLTFINRGRQMVLFETVTVRNLPHEFSGTYEANGVFNTVKNHFEKIDDSHTRYRTENEFRFSGFMKLIAFLWPGAFKKQSMKFLTDFKNFAESAV